VPGDAELVTSVANQIEGHTICAFGEALAWPAKAFIQKFPEEFKERIGEALLGINKRREPLNYELQSSH
jgi:NADH-quinone oxidoreductase subunit F